MQATQQNTKHQTNAVSMLAGHLYDAAQHWTNIGQMPLACRA